MPPLARVDRLAVAFPAGPGAWQRVVDGASLTVADGEAVGLVGESGCGKTLTGLALLGLVPEPGRIVAGVVEVVGLDILRAGEASLCALRGGTVGIVLQEPSQALNPVRCVASQVIEAARLHGVVDAGPSARAEAQRLLSEVGISEPEDLLPAFPHQLSGGQRQRILLASALSGRPKLLIADEPTSALDPVAQSRLVGLLVALRQARGLGLLFISHDLTLVGRIAEKVVVMYAGETVEVAATSTMFGAPAHPYTCALVATVLPAGGSRGAPLPSIPGRVPPPSEWGRACRFAPRCPAVFERCRRARPALAALDGGHLVRCFLHSDAEEHDG